MTREFDLDKIRSRCKGLSCLVFAAMEIAATQCQLTPSSQGLLRACQEKAEDFHFSDEERVLLNELLSNPEIGRVSEALWRLEDLGTTLWSLGALTKLPPVWQPFDESVLSRLPDLESAQSVRNLDEIEEVIEVLKTINWRFHIGVFHAMGNISPETDILELVKEKVPKLQNRSGLIEMVDGDLGFEGVPFSRLSDGRMSTVKKIVDFRLRILEEQYGSP